MLSFVGLKLLSYIIGWVFSLWIHIISLRRVYDLAFFLIEKFFWRTTPLLTAQNYPVVSLFL